MDKTILLGINNGFSTRVNKWLVPIAGFVFLLIGIRHMYQYYAAPETGDDTPIILGVMTILFGLYMSFYGLTAFSPKSSLALRAVVNDEWIEIKNRYLKRTRRLIWDEIQAIEFDRYLISFRTKGSSRVFPLQTNADVSVEIKKAIREIADQKGVEVIGG